MKPHTHNKMSLQQKRLNYIPDFSFKTFPVQDDNSKMSAYPKIPHVCYPTIYFDEQTQDFAAPQEVGFSSVLSA